MITEERQAEATDVYLTALNAGATLNDDHLISAIRTVSSRPGSQTASRRGPASWRRRSAKRVAIGTLVAAVALALLAGGAAAERQLRSNKVAAFCRALEPGCKGIVFTLVPGETGKGSPIYLMPVDGASPTIVSRSAGMAAAGSRETLYTIVLNTESRSSKPRFSLLRWTDLQSEVVVSDIDDVPIVSRDGALVAYTRAGTIYMLDLPKGDVRHIIPVTWSDFSLLAVAPDDRTVAARVRNSAGVDELWVIDVDGLVQKIVTPIDAQLGDAKWLNAETLIVVSSSNSLYALPLDGPPHAIVPTTVGLRAVYPSPDGTRLAIASGLGESARCTIFSVDGEALFATPLGQEFRDWNPDGTQLATLSSTQGGFVGPDDLPYFTGVSTLHLFDRNGNEIRALKIPLGEPIAGAIWSSDGKDLIVGAGFH